MNSKNLVVGLFMVASLLMADGVMAVEQQPPNQSGGKDNCKPIRGEYKHWDGHPPYERIETPGGIMYGLISSFEEDTNLQVPQYPLPDNLQRTWNAGEIVAGEFLFCFATDTEKFKAYEIEPMQLGWIKSFTAMPSQKPSAQLKEDWDQKRWHGAPQSMNKPVAEWIGDTLHVRVVVEWMSDWPIDDSNVDVSARGNKLTLCYRHKAQTDVPDVVSPGVEAPVFLDFLVSYIPHRNYSIIDVDSCPN